MQNKQEGSKISVTNVIYLITHVFFFRWSDVPMSNQTVAVFREYLWRKGVDYTNMRRPELWTKVKEVRERDPGYKIDQLASDRGIIILKIPPYHPELNAIGKNWPWACFIAI